MWRIRCLPLQCAYSLRLFTYFVLVSRSLDVFCPLGSAGPMRAAAGYYTVGPSDLFWEAGNYTVQAVRQVHASVLTENSAASRRWAERICPRGHYCVGGVKYICPAGRFGQFFGESTANCTGPCPAGFYCPEGTEFGDTVGQLTLSQLQTFNSARCSHSRIV